VKRYSGPSIFRKGFSELSPSLFTISKQTGFDAIGKKPASLCKLEIVL
jgi:hypothetical protein